MGKWFHNDVLDASLKEIIDNCTRVFMCSGQPTTYQEASVDLMLAAIVVTPGAGNGDFTIGDGDSSGRKATLLEQSVAASNTGTANHVAFGDSANSKLLAVTELNSSYALTSGQTVALEAVDITNPDPV
jgi:hypothetical protein